jgi:hypothetical protein
VNYLQQNYNIEIERGTIEENNGEFQFKGLDVKFKLERFYLQLPEFRLAFEIDENFHSGPAHPPDRELVREFEYFKSFQDQNVVLVRYGFKSRHRD